MPRPVLTALALLAASAPLATAQRLPRIVPTNQTVISGYGTVGYSAQLDGEQANAFGAAIAPIFLFHFAERFLFEAELEFELEGEGTETGLEYAQLDYLLNDNVTLVGGKFLLPFGVFGERLHPTWINKFPTAPPLYGHGMTVFGAEPLVPILADVGFMARGALAPGAWNLGFNAYVIQGPGQEEAADPAEEPEAHFPGSSSDNNSNKTFGGRLDIALPPWLEVNGSAFRGLYDDANSLAFTAWNVAAESRMQSFEMRGEYLRTLQELGAETRARSGAYVQLSYRWRRLEPVVRWTGVFSATEDGIVTEAGARQFAFGAAYWFAPAIALMAGYELNRETEAEFDNDRLVAHVAFGF